MKHHPPESATHPDEPEPREAFRRRIEINNSLIRSDRLDIGRQIVTERSALFTEIVREWAQEQHTHSGYDRPFAVVALGGTGRAELTPYSDLDFAFLFDDQIEGNPFLLKLQEQVVHAGQFESRYGFSFEPLPFCFDDVINLEGKQMNSFLDMAAVYDPSNLADAFRERIRETYNPFEHFLHVREFWLGQWEEASRRSEDLDQFDIKNEGLRIFLAGVWTLAGKNFCHSREIYEILEDPRDLEAYEFLLRIRAFVHSRRTAARRPSAGGNHPEDILSFDDFLSFGEMLSGDADEKMRFEFGNEIRARLLSARRRMALFAKSVIRHELRLGRQASQDSPIVYGLGGLHIPGPKTNLSPFDRSRAALSLLIASQRYRTPIDTTELQNAFHNAGDWLVRVPELSSLFYEENGSLADTFEFMSQIDGAEDRLFPGYGKFESSLDERVITERKSLRGKLQRQKISALERLLVEGRSQLERAATESRIADFQTEVDLGVEAALLDINQIAAIKLGLKTKRLALTDDDMTIHGDTTFDLYDRFSSGFSGIPLDEYYQPFIDEAGFNEPTINLVRFLIANRRAFKLYSQPGIADAQLVEEMAELCGDEDHLRTLFVFTCADRTEWESENSEPARWFTIKELYAKTLAKFRPSSDPTRTLAAAGFSSDESLILKDFGRDFFAGRYHRYASRFGSRLLRLAQEPDYDVPKVSLLRDGASIILGVAARDFKGLAATISGELWKNEISLRQAHLFSSSNHGLALDFFHLEVIRKSFPESLADLVEKAISSRLHINEEDTDQLPPLNGTTSFGKWRPHRYCLRFEGDQRSEGLIYTLTCRMYWHLKANIFGLSAHSTRTKSYVSIYHNLPNNISPVQAAHLVEEYF